MFSTRFAGYSLSGSATLCGIDRVFSHTEPADDSALRGAASNGSQWLAYGRDYAETRISPHKQIEATNMQQLGLTKVWPTRALGATDATPLVSDGILYGALSYGAVFAYALRTQERIWEWDAKVPFATSSAHVAASSIAAESPGS
jgi:glucose dehydrogenase